MPANRTRKINEVKDRLLTRLRNGFYQPGDRFLSNRDVAELFEISYQTAHRLIAELCDEGHLERRPQSGTYVPGGPAPLTGVQLIFDARAQKNFSFGSKLVSKLTERLDADGVQWTLAWSDGDWQLDATQLPVIWESPQAVERCLRARRQAVLINDRPRGGLEALLIDSVSTDDFLGGACAGELLRSQ
ncbi:MAG: GntR family transcriptional regulator, partial [Planctomycetaceae bacterium]|nr:GntR family transcriptional regulator [Planctomycetaceae bacterium]